MLLRELTYPLTEAQLEAKINAAIIAIKSDGSMWRKVKQGSINSPALKTIQTALTQLGFPAKADGWFGPGTAKAVRDFQTSKGLKPDGDPGPNTLKAMANAVGGGRGKSVEKPGERQAYLDKNKETPVAQAGPEVTVAPGTGKDGPAGGAKPIADFKGADTAEKVVAVVDNALTIAREKNDPKEIAQIIAAGDANFNNVAGPGERADRATAIISKLTPVELENPVIKSAVAAQQLQVDLKEMDPEEALRKFVQSRYAFVIPERFRGKATAQQKFEAMVRAAQDEQMMSAFVEPNKATEIIQDEIKKIESDPMSATNQDKDRTNTDNNPNKGDGGGEVVGAAPNQYKKDSDGNLTPVSKPKQPGRSDVEINDFKAAVDDAPETEKPVVGGMTQEVNSAVQILGGDLSTSNLEKLVVIIEKQSTKPILQKIIGRRLEKLYSKDDLADLEGIEGDELEAAKMLVQLKVALMDGTATNFVYKPASATATSSGDGPGSTDEPLGDPLKGGELPTGPGGDEPLPTTGNNKEEEPKFTTRERAVLVSTAEQLYLSMKGGTGIGTSKNKLNRQLKKIKDEAQYNFVASEYKKEYGTDLFDHFYDEMSDRNIKKYVEPEMKRLGIEMPERSEFESFTYESILDGLDNLVNERQVWAKAGSKVVRKYRCMSGRRKGRVVGTPGQCFAAPDIKKRILLKKTKARLGNRMTKKAKRTKRTNPASKRVAQMNKSSR
tara:strand:+ start:2048 stop:4216 length:2169 start_codon:yes stop_codon:yes gene_type:complete